MDRINTPTKDEDLFGPGKHGFKDGNLSLGVQPTALNAAFFNDLQEEAVGIIEGAGLTPAAGNRTQLRQAIDIMIAKKTGNDWKASVRYTTSANITLSGLGTQAGGDWAADLTAGDRVLAKDQTTAADRVIWVAAAGAWTKADDSTNAGDLTSGMVISVESGQNLADSMWMLTTDGPITIGTTALAWARKDAGAAKALQPGTPLEWPTPSCPNWALVRDGAAVSRSAYAGLFAALCPTRSGTITNGQNTITGLSSTADLYIGMPVEAAGIPAGTTIASITSLTAVTMSANASAGGTVAITLFYFGYGSGGSSTTFGLPDDRGLFTRGLDSGRGYEQTRLNGTTTSGQNTLTGLSSTKGLYVGMPLSAVAGIPGGTTVASITSATAITMSANASLTGARDVIFTGGQIGNERSDSLQGHTHQYTSKTSNDGFPSVDGSSGLDNGVGTLDLGIVADQYGSGTPRVGPETRGKFRNYLPIIVY